MTALIVVTNDSDIAEGMRLVRTAQKKMDWTDNTWNESYISKS